MIYYNCTYNIVNYGIAETHFLHSSKVLKYDAMSIHR